MNRYYVVGAVNDGQKGFEFIYVAQTAGLSIHFIKAS
jgi:hypothetical protein